MASDEASSTSTARDAAHPDTSHVREDTLSHANGRMLPLVASSNEKRHPLFGMRDPDMRKARKEMFTKTLKSFGILTIVLWIVLPIFWGSTYKLIGNLKNLNINFVDFDSAASPNNAILGPAFTQVVENIVATTPSSAARLGYVVRNPADFPNGLDDVRHSVLLGECWGAVVVNANATSSWRNAVENGGSYDPQGSIALLFSGARFFQIILLYILPLMISNSRQAIKTASQTALQTILTSLDSGYTAPTALVPSGGLHTVATSLQTLQVVPSAVGTPFGFYENDLRPITAWSSAAVFEAGNIYFLIFAFHLCLFQALARTRTGIADRLKYRSLVLLRLVVPFVAYFFMALWYTCVIAAFQIPFNNTVGRAGFVVDWALNYIGLLAMGLAFETVIELLGLPVLPLFLIAWIISNITSSFSPLEVEGRFYRLLRAWPFYHHVEASKIIFFNTGPAHQLGVHFGALFALTAINVVALSLAVWFTRWRSERKERKEAQEKDGEREKAT